jgi:hypothetical protein
LLVDDVLALVSCTGVLSIALHLSDAKTLLLPGRSPKPKHSRTAYLTFLIFAHLPEIDKFNLIHI